MTFWDSLVSALQSLKVNVLRSALTTLGIVIGVGAVIAMVAIGAGAQSRVNDLINSLGSNLLMITPGSVTQGGVRLGTGTRFTLTEDDAEAIARDLSTIVVASAPTVRGGGQVVAGNVNWATSIQGVTPEFFDAREWEPGMGRLFSQEEVTGAGKVVLLGATVAENLFSGGDPVGQIVRLQNVPLEVVGVLARKGETPFGGDQDDTVMIPLSTAKKRVLGDRQLRGNLVHSISIKVADSSLMDEAERDTRDLLRQRHRLRDSTPDDFTIRNLSQIMETRAESSRVMTLLLAAVASVSLIVGGIGIMNIMLVTVTERTREIGLRMAIGARGRDILTQFVIEAVMLSLIGGIIGICLGLGGSIMIAELAGWPMLIQPQAIVIAVAFSAFIGVFFGFYPARRAARLDPIEALRYD
ncbi:MAG TPA: ABC transporter permease [Alphaproteobacteria bacterium]|nr:ABC transporter permease [Alphaproteobacteria bacterium]